MSTFTEIDIKKMFEGEDNLEDFSKFLNEYGIEDGLNEITLKHTKKRLETLLALANEGKDQKLASKKDLIKKLLENLKDVKEKRAQSEALRKVYAETSLLEHMDIKELDKHIKTSLKEYKKYEHFKKHEEKIADKWIKSLSK